ncbi:MAG: TIGR03084 family metal-binding protein [Actinomycetota bacterium]|nr:TIGR03084 family metal-binding protein [Actinomycetota bacterium]
MNDKLDAVLADLEAEGAQLESWVSPLEAGQWSTPTPADGWTIAHQIAHLAWTDETSVKAAFDADAFAETIKAAVANPTGFVDIAVHEGAAVDPAELMARWQTSRRALVEALRDVPEGTKIPWYGPPMSPTSMATARLMETWAHAHDVAESLGIEPPRTGRAKHVAYLGVRTRDFAHQMRGEDPPTEEFRVELTGPDGAEWAWGPEDAAQRVVGDGWDFALLATRRLHTDDADVKATGEDAQHWLTIVQAFAGLPGTDPLRRSER